MKAVTVTHDLQIGFTELEKPLYRSAGAFVGGHIEIVNEEFRLLGLPENEIGCYLYQTHLHGNPIQGNFLIIKEEGPDLVGLEEPEVLLVMGAMLEVKNLLASDVWRKGMMAL